jgi:hypothetical protein
LSVTADILQAYRQPRAVIRRHLSAGVREDRALGFLVVACLLIFIAQWPRLARQAHLDDSVPLPALIGGALMAWLFIAPLAFYAIAAVSAATARMMGGRGDWFGSRLALFWSLLAISPLLLLNGLLAGFLGSSAVTTSVGLVVLAVFLYLWGAALVEAELGPRETKA